MYLQVPVVEMLLFLSTARATRPQLITDLLDSLDCQKFRP